MILVGFIIAQIAILAVIVVVLKRLIFQDTTSAINRLTKLDNMNREKERQLSTRLEETEALLKQKLAELSEQEKKMKLEAERAANQLHDDIIKQARQEAEDLIKKAIASKEKMKMDAMIEAEAKMIDLCGEVLGKVMGPLAQTAAHEQLVEEFLKELQDTDMSMLANVTKVDLVAATKISDATLERVKKVVKEKLKHDVEIVVKEEKAIVGGIVMKFGSLQIDDSLKERLNSAGKEMKDQLKWKYKV